MTTSDQIFRRRADYTKDRALRKAAEECSELTTVLVQQLNKPHKDFTERIIDELGDAYFRLDMLSEHLDQNKIAGRFREKLNKHHEKQDVMLNKK